MTFPQPVRAPTASRFRHSTDSTDHAPAISEGPRLRWIQRKDRRVVGALVMISRLGSNTDCYRARVRWQGWGDPVYWRTRPGTEGKNVALARGDFTGIRSLRRAPVSNGVEPEPRTILSYLFGGDPGPNRLAASMHEQTTHLKCGSSRARIGCRGRMQVCRGRPVAAGFLGGAGGRCWRLTGKARERATAPAFR